MDTTTEALTDSTPLGAVSEQYASTLMTAVIRAGAPGRVIRAGAPGRVIRGHYPPGTDAAQDGLHARWSFVGLHLQGQDVRIFCVSTSQGVLLMIEARGGTMRCLPTWGAPAATFGAAALAVAHEIGVPSNRHRLPILQVLRVSNRPQYLRLDWST